MGGVIDPKQGVPYGCTREGMEITRLTADNKRLRTALSEVAAMRDSALAHANECRKNEADCRAELEAARIINSQIADQLLQAQTERDAATTRANALASDWDELMDSIPDNWTCKFPETGESLLDNILSMIKYVDKCHADIAELAEKRRQAILSRIKAAYNLTQLAEKNQELQNALEQAIKYWSRNSVTKGECGVTGAHWAECDLCGQVAEARALKIPHLKDCPVFIATIALAFSTTSKDKK